jgi:hypothetical protein
VATRFQFVPRREPPELLDLPWSQPLAQWRHPRLIRMAHGESRHVVRFVTDGERVYALKEMEEDDARHEYGMLRALATENLPVVEAVGLVTGRESVDGHPLDAVLVTRYLDYSLPFVYLLGVEATQNLGARLLDAGVVLLVRLHLECFYWGDCSLSNLLFRRDAGEMMAYLVDAETAERHVPIPDGMRLHDVEIARENIVGGLLDLQAAGRLTTDLDPVLYADLLEQRYTQLWHELTGTDEFDAADRHAIEGRLRRLNELGFDAGELVVEQTPEDQPRLRITPALVEEGHHSRELRHLTGLEVQENQARRLLNDIAAYGAYLSEKEKRAIAPAVAAARWFADVYEPIVASVPPELRGRREPAQLFHELLEHRYYMSEDAGRPVTNDEALSSYVNDVLPERPDERLLIDAAGEDGAGGEDDDEGPVGPAT